MGRSKAEKGGGEGAQPVTEAPAFDPREFMEAVSKKLAAGFCNVFVDDTSTTSLMRSGGEDTTRQTM